MFNWRDPMTFDPTKAAIWRHRQLFPNDSPEAVAEALELDPSLVARVLATSGSAEPERMRLLRKGMDLTGGDRNKTYGPPYDNLNACAQVWSAYVSAKFGLSETFRMTAEDVAHMMTLVKMTRTFYGAYHADNYLDGAVYQAIAGECRVEEER
jgi:hypothetical protein